MPLFQKYIYTARRDSKPVFGKTKEHFQYTDRGKNTAFSELTVSTWGNNINIYYFHY